MELESSYNLLGIVRDDGIRTYRAIEKASGQELQVHLFAKPDSEPDRALFRALRSLPLSKRKELLEIGMEGEMPYVVTDKLPDSSSAREWLTKLSGVPAKPSTPVFLAGSWKTGTPIPDELVRASHSAPPVLPAVKKPDELSADYTRVMRIPQALSGTPPVVETGKGDTGKPEVEVSAPVEVSRKPQPVLPPEPPAAAVQPPVEEPDDFARMFGNAPPAAAAGTPQPATPQPATPQKEPGEFTRMFLATQPPAPPAAVVPPPAAPSSDPGDFTSQFLATLPAERAQPLPAPPASPPPAAVAAPLPPAAPTEPGEFTRQFLATLPPERVQPVSPPQPASPPPQLPIEAASRFLDPRQTEPVVPPQQPAATVPPLTSGGTPGEFTSLFLAAQPANPPAAPQAGPADRAVQQPATPSPYLQAVAPPPIPPPPAEPSSDAATRLFQAVTPSTPPKGGKQPGEFTQMFPSVKPSGSPLGPVVPDNVPGGGSQGTPKEGSSEFTRFFESPMYPTPAGNQKMPSSTPMSTPQQANRPSATPSEFTQMFGNPNKSASAPPPPLGAGNSNSSSSATGVFSTPKSSPSRGSMKSSGPGASGPGEFTRMMSASSAPTLGQPLAQSNAPEAKAKSNVLLYVAGGCVLVAIILVIVFFAMR